MLVCFLVFQMLLNLLHSEANTIEVDGYFFIDFLKVNGSLIKIKILVSVVKYTFIKVKLECQEMK